MPIKPGGGGGATSGDDTLVGTATDNIIRGLGGNDTISGLGGNDTLAGNSGGDTIDGGDGNDTLFSGDVSPLIGTGSPLVLDRGTEVDTLVGGDGADTIFAGYGDNVDGGADGYGGDKLYISFQGATGGIQFDAHLASQTIGGGTITGIEAVSWVEGSNYGDYIDVGNDIFGANSDFTQVYGMAGNDTLIAGYYTQVLGGGDGNDILDARGSYYIRTVDGGAGDDTIYTNANTIATVNGGGGNDTIYSDFDIHGGAGDDVIHVLDSYYSASVTGDDGNDTIYGSNGNENIDGGIGNDTIEGGGGDDLVMGGAGADVIGGGLGKDTLTGGADDDTFVFGQADGKDTITDFTSGEQVQINGYTSAQSITQSGTDVIVVFSSADQINLQNTSVAAVQAGLQFMPPTNDTLVGGPGNDYLHGYGGNDTISGDDGNDTLAGGTGADTIDGGAGNDTIYSDNVSPAWNFFFGTDVYSPPLLDRGSEVDTITGGVGDDTIFAGYGDNVDGGANDNYTGDTLLISFQGASAGVSFDLNLGTQTIGGGTITGIESVSWVEGSNYADTIDLNAGYTDTSGVIFGMGGDDTLIGGYGTSALDGGDGNDIVDGRASYYLGRVDGGAGDDTLYTNPNANGVANGGDGNDTIYANADVHGGAGDDIIHALDGYYSGAVHGDDGNDTIYGRNGGDPLLAGDAGDDRIDGGTGDDTIDGGSGNDVLTGGDGNDKFIVGNGNDVITDFTAGDTLVVREAFAAQALDQVGADVVIALPNGSQLTLQNTDVATVQAALHFSEPQAHDIALSADGSKIYATDDSGSLNVYNAETGVLLNSWHVGNDLGGMDISPDGTFAIITELQPVATIPAPSPFGYPTFEVALHKVDLATGAVSDFTYQTTAMDYAFYDAAILPNGNVLLTEAGYGGYSSGWGTMKLLNLSTGQFSDASGQITSDSVLTKSGSAVLVGEVDISDARTDVYSAGIGVTAVHQYYEDGVQGFNQGVQAISAQANLVAQSVGQDIYIYNTQLQYKFNLAQLHPELSTGTAGLAFDSTGQYLFLLNTQADAIYMVSMSDWNIVGEYSVGAVMNGQLGTITGAFGNRLLVAPDTSYFIVQTDDGIIRVDAVASPTDSPDYLAGTAGADTIDALGGNDTIHGFAGNDTLTGNDGNDTLSGGTGNDLLTGGTGNDTFLYKTGDGSDTITDFASGDAVTVSGYGSAQSTTQVGADVVVIFSSGDQITFQNTDVATVQAGLDFDVQPPMNLVGTSANDTLTGGSGNDTLNGAGGNDILDGKAGADTMIGGAGNDTFDVDNSGDVVKELSAQGTDIVRATISYTLGANVENGILDGSSAINLTGNSVANLLTGNGGDNFLYGLGGNDTLKGGGGNDTLRGGLGTDTLTGGLGADWFEFEKGGGNDKVTDFLSGTDKLDFSLIPGLTNADIKAVLNNGNELIKVDVNHDGRADFTITLVGVTDVNASDYIFG